jgi:adenine phosphoribosyltransferase
LVRNLNSTALLVARLKATSLLRIARDRFRYAELSEMTGIDEPTLSRYVHGILVPSVQRARQIVEVLQSRIDLSEKVRSLLEEKITTYPDASSIFLRNPAVPDWISYCAYERYAGMGIETVLSVEDGGVLIAVLVASILKAKLLYASRARGVHVGRVLEEHCWPYRSSNPELVNPRLKRVLSLPDGYIQRGDRVLLVDDIVWSGETIRALGRFVVASKAEIAAAFCVGVLFQDIARSLEGDLGCKLDYVTELRPTASKTQINE